MITITHTPTDGTFLDGTERGDGTNHILKPLGWKWSPNLGWYLRSSRESAPRTTMIESTAEKQRVAAVSGRDRKGWAGCTTRPTPLIVCVISRCVRRLPCR